MLQSPSTTLRIRPFKFSLLFLSSLIQIKGTSLFFAAAAILLIFVARSTPHIKQVHTSFLTCYAMLAITVSSVQMGRVPKISLNH